MESYNFNYFNFVLSGVVGTMFIILGVIGNILSSVVLSRREMKSPVNCILHGLTYFDICVLLCALLKDALSAFAFNDSRLAYYKEQLFPRIFPILYPIKMISITGSTWSTAVVTIERYIAVCHPLKARSLCTYGRAQLCNVCVLIFSICFNLPRFWDFQVIEKFDNKTNRTLPQLRKALQNDSEYVKIYNIWLGLLLRFLLPFLVISALNGAICRTIRAANENRKCLSHQAQNEMRLALMLVCVVVFYFVCNVFTLFLKICRLFKYSSRYLEVFAFLLVAINSSVNFVIYCFFTRKFRKVFIKTFWVYWSQASQSTVQDSGDSKPHEKRVRVGCSETEDTFTRM